MKALKRRLREALHGLRKARDRWLGARTYLRRVRKNLSRANKRLGLKPGDDRGGGKVRDEIKVPKQWSKDKLERILDERGRLIDRKHNLADQVKHRKRIKQRYRKKVKFLREEIEDKKDESDGCVSTPGRPWNPSGKQIATWMVPIVDRAWDRGWRGILNSGYRSPEYSQQLCYSICGAPVCPGTCAGTTSNHTKCAKPEGAIDVSDPWKFDDVTPELHNALGSADPWHMSVSGR